MFLRLVAIVTLLTAAAGAARAAVEDFRIAQAVPEGAGGVRAYLDVWDEAGGAVEGLSAAAVSATLGGERVDVASVHPFRSDGEGTAYIFAVDISRSLSATQYEGIRQALERWIVQLDAGDRAALLSFGDESRLVVDFTGNRELLRDAIAELAPNDGTTVLFRGLYDAIELSSRRDPGLPRRRVLVVLSDGLDEGSGLTSDDVLRLLGERGLPLYAVGFGGPRRQESLDLLLRLATYSGGRFAAAEGADFATAYEALRDAIERVWVVEGRCPACRSDGSVYHLQVNLELADRVLSKGIDVRLLAPLGGLPGIAAGEAEAGSSPPAGAPSPALPSDSAGTRTAPRRLLLVGGIVAGAASLLALGWIALRRRRRAAPEPGGKRVRARRRMTRRERRLNEVPLGSAPLGPVLVLRLVVVRGSRRGRQYRFLVRDGGVLGSSESCEFRLAEEEGLDGTQVKLRAVEGQLVASDASRESPSLLNGVPLAEAVLATGDLIGNRRFIARVHLG